MCKWILPFLLFPFIVNIHASVCIHQITPFGVNKTHFMGFVDSIAVWIHRRFSSMKSGDDAVVCARNDTIR